MVKEVSLPRYQAVAVSIAKEIVAGRYQEGQLVHARTELATAFEVSPETARKAVRVLVDLGVMSVQQGSGTRIASCSRAQDFLDQYDHVASVTDTAQALQASIERQQLELSRLSDFVGQLVAQKRKFKLDLPFVPMSLVLAAESSNFDKAIRDLNVWQLTGATIIAVLHKDKLIISPGPYTKIYQGDTLYFVGDDVAKDRMRRLFS